VELMRVRAQGFAIDDEEFEEGLRCVGAPVFDHRGHVVASLSMAAPVFRLRKERVVQVARLVVAAAQGLSDDLGHRNSSEARRGSAPRAAVAARPKSRRFTS
jgi:IclR family acetate operon transcriptional repressor